MKTTWNRMRPTVAVAAFSLAIVVALTATRPTNAGTLTFETLQHGEIVNLQFGPQLIVSAVNPNRAHDLAIVFDSVLSNTADPDLEGPPWNGGNLPSDTVLGKMLIIAENNADNDGDSLIDDPDDEGNRPAGQLIFDFGAPSEFFGFDIIDLEGVVAEASSIEFYAGGGLLDTVNFTEFTSAGPLFDASIGFGNNSANRISPLTATGLGIQQFDRVILNLGGSTAIDNIRLPNEIFIPEPGSAVLMLIGAAVIGATSARRRRRR